MALIIEKVMTSRSNRFNTPVTSQGRELFDRLPSQARCLELNLVISIINDGFQLRTASTSFTLTDLRRGARIVSSRQLIDLQYEPEENIRWCCC